MHLFKRCGTSFFIYTKHSATTKRNMSSVENPGWLFDIGDYTTQLYGDYNKPIYGSLLTNQYIDISLELPPSQDASDHQDDITCLGSGIAVTGRGPYPKYINISRVFSQWQGVFLKSQIDSQLECWGPELLTKFIAF